MPAETSPEPAQLSFAEQAKLRIELRRLERAEAAKLRFEPASAAPTLTRFEADFDRMFAAMGE